MTRDTIAAALMVWLIGAIVGWTAGWAARGEQNRGWHRNLVRQLAQVRHELAEALNELDGRGELAHALYTAERVPAPAPAVIHLHLATPAPWPVPRPMAPDTTRFLDAMPVWPAEEVQS